MSHEADRAQFIEAMRAEGMAAGIARDILRDAQVIQTCAVKECNDESADRDRVPCPKVSQSEGSCLCRDYGAYQGSGESDDGDQHGDVARVSACSYRAERRIERLLATLGADCKPCNVWFVGETHCTNCKAELTPKFVPVFGGDPRGCCVKLKVPSGRNDSWGGEGVMCVPAKG